MTRLTRTLALSVCVFSLLFSSVHSVAAAIDPGVASRVGAKSNFEAVTDKNLQAVVDAEDKSLPSINSLVGDTSLSWQAHLYFSAAGVPTKSKAYQSMSEEQKRILADRYGNGLIGDVGNGIAMLYTPPASSQTYVADLLHSAHIVPQAQAQGLGFASLDPILGTWKIFRNVAYLFFVVIFLIIGFMIMFRQKIGGQTVVTAQQAIPGIIISLVFVTFSYAIAGFLIDLMYLLMYLMLGLFRLPTGNDILNKDIFGAMWDVLIGRGTGVSIFSSVGDAVGNFTGAIFDNLGATGDFLGWLAGITAALVVAVSILFAAFKVFFELLKTYVALVLSIATSPLVLMMGALPGQEAFSKWVKGIVGNLLVFPVVLMAFIIYDMFSQNAFNQGGVGQGGFLPPFLPGRGNANAIMTMVGVGILLVIPEVIKEVKKLFGADGGVFDTLGTAMLKNAGQGEVAIPAAFALGHGSYAAGRGFSEARRRGLGVRETLGATFGQGVQVDAGDGSPPVTVGGFFRQAVKKGYKQGQGVRRIIDRVGENRILEAEDIETALTTVADKIAGENKDKPKPTTPPGPIPEV